MIGSVEFFNFISFVFINFFIWFCLISEFIKSIVKPDLKA